ncbi:MAG: uroporphyrinogen-III synthase [Caldilineae bacterium]|nr:MAG: uroporphyrinogen-III synthase [Caldilineae bacterium]
MTGGRLRGLGVVNTRAAHQAAALTRLLEAEGARVYHYPTIAIAPPEDASELDQALQETLAGAYDWLVLTSGNTVRVLAQRLEEQGRDRRALGSADVKVAAVGSSTATAAQRQLGLDVDVLPEEFVAESLADALHMEPGDRVFLPQSALARPVLAHALRGAGAQVTAVTAYHTVLGAGGDNIPLLLWQGAIDVVTFTSSSTVRNFVKRLTAEQGELGMLADVVVACIGPVTAQTAQQLGLAVHVVPEEHTIEGLVEALCHSGSTAAA